MGTPLPGRSLEATPSSQSSPLPHLPYRDKGLWGGVIVSSARCLIAVAAIEDEATKDYNPRQNLFYALPNTNHQSAEHVPSVDSHEAPLILDLFHRLERYQAC